MVTAINAQTGEMTHDNTMRTKPRCEWEIVNEGSVLLFKLLQHPTYHVGETVSTLPPDNTITAVYHQGETHDGTDGGMGGRHRKLQVARC